MPEKASTLELSLLAPADQHIVLLGMCGHQLGGALLESSDYDAATRWMNKLLYLWRAMGLKSSSQRMPVNCGYDQLTGGIDVMSTLVQSRPVTYTSVLARADQSLLLVPSPERQRHENIHALCNALDTGQINAELARVCVIAHVHREEADDLSNALLDRLAFFVSENQLIENDQDVFAAVQQADVPDGTGQVCDLDNSDVDNSDVDNFDVEKCAAAANAAMHRSIRLSDNQLRLICGAAIEHGIYSMRASLQCACVSRLSAALAGRDVAIDRDIELAMKLCYAWRAISMQQSQPDDLEKGNDEDDQDQPDSANDNADPAQNESPLNNAEPSEPDTADRKSPDKAEKPDQSEQAPVSISLPEKLLSEIANGQRESLIGKHSGGRMGRNIQIAQRGRLVGVERYRPGSAQKINVLATLREATPWQSQRRKKNTISRPIIYPQDLRASRYKQAVNTVVIFAVDASGSAAAHRLAEAKGAVELLLAECYERRDQVALVVFQGAQATLVLPPTRSLVRARRELSRFPTGGGTPLPSALKLVGELSIGIRRAGHTPLLCLVTDGRANVDRDGIGGRARATQQSLDGARQLRSMGVHSLVIDIAIRITPLAGKLATAMDGQYLALPKANASSISAAVNAAKTNVQQVAVA